MNKLDNKHEHNHDHHGHTHTHQVASSPEEAEALLRYMLDHNKHHAEELHELSHCFEDEISDLVHDAVDTLMNSNNYLEQALSLINNSK